MTRTSIVNLPDPGDSDSSPEGWGSVGTDHD